MASHISFFSSIPSQHKCSESCYDKMYHYTEYGIIIAKGNIIEGIEAKE